MSASTLDLLRTMSELIFSKKAISVWVAPSWEVRKSLDEMRDYQDLIAKAVGIRPFKIDWSQYEIPLLESEECLKIFFHDENWKIVSVSMVLMNLEDCDRSLLASLIRKESWIKEVA